MLRALAEMMPRVTLPPSPNGLPIAITQSPTRIAAEEPNFTSFSALWASTFSSAMSVLVSLPISSALSFEPSCRLIWISSAPSITWLLVTMMPCLPSTMKPEPSEDTMRSEPERPLRLSKNSSKYSWKGEPLGTLGSGRPCGPLIAWLVEILTTASISSSATGATDCGPRVCAVAGSAAARHKPKPAPAAGAAEDQRVCRAPRWPHAVIACIVLFSYRPERRPTPARVTPAFNSGRSRQVDGKPRRLSTRPEALNRG